MASKDGDNEADALLVSSAPVAVYVPPSAEWLKNDNTALALYVALCVLSIGIVPIVALFDPPVGVRLRCVKCSAEDSDLAVVRLSDKEGVLKEYVSKTEKHAGAGKERIVALEANCLRFVASSLDDYELQVVPEVPVDFSRFLHPASHFYCANKEDAMAERSILLAQYGPNSMSIPETNVVEIAVKHALNPVILFGYFSIIIWTLEEYYFYSGFLAAVVLLAVYAMTLDTIFNLQKLRDLAGQHGVVEVADPFRETTGKRAMGKAVVARPDTVLVAGDRIVITPGMTLPCDAVLISGRVVMDEAKLTGESVPVAKGPIELEGLGDADRALPLLSAKQPSASASAFAREVDIGEKRAGSVLFGGTTVRSVGGGAGAGGGDCVAVVYRTGFRSSKGLLIATLLTPKDRFLRIFEDLLWVIFFLFVVASLLYIYEAVYLRSIGTSWGEVVLLYFNALTVAIPVALIVCIIAATSISIWRLKYRDINVSESSAVNMAGVVSVACFDKTGTLTDDALVYNNAFISSASAVTEDGGSSSSSSSGWAAKLLGLGGDGDESLRLVDCGSLADSTPRVCQEIMACCHNLSLLAPYAPPVGDPLEVELLRASGWTLHAGGISGYMSASPPVSREFGGERDRYQILRHFEFSPDRLRAASLLLRPSGECIFLIKGSPETLVALCRPDTVPPDVNAQLVRLAKLGLRVIALAFRKLPSSTDLSKASKSTQEQLEAGGDIVFAGLLTLTNRLKPDSLPTVHHLQRADVHVNMITGDHVYTAVSVAISCGILCQPDQEGAVAGEAGVQLFVVDERDEGRSVGPGNCVTITDYMSGREKVGMSVEQLLLLTVADTPSSTPSSSSSSQSPPSSSSNGASSRARGTSYLDPALSGSGSEEPSFSASASASASDQLTGAKGRARVQLAVTGRALRALHRHHPPALVNSLIRSCQVFARTKPNDKKFVVEELMYTPRGVTFGPGDDGEEDEVLFCGDGANDMAALRACTVGLSLCDVETSIAAPVTSKQATPGAVIELLLEGRCSLITTYVLVHYNIMFGYIVLLMTCLLFGYGLMVSDSMYFIQGLFYTTLPGIAIALTPHSERLGTELPPKRYFTPWLLTQLLPQLLIFTGVQVYALYLLSVQSFYTRYATDDPLSSTYSYEATTLENVVLAQLMIASVVSTIGEPYRLEWYTNYAHLVILALLTGWFIYQCYSGTSSFAEDTLKLEPIPAYFGGYIIAIAVVNTALSFAAWAVADRCCRSPRKRRQLAILAEAS